MTTIAEALSQARARYTRLAPAEALAAQRDGAVLVDVRPVEQRREHGEIPGAVVLNRNVLEWRADPTSGHAAPWASHDAQVVVVCQEGYASSLAAAQLLDLGIPRATDLAGGFEAWAAAGLPVQEL